MELLDLKVGGLTIGTSLGVCGVFYMINSVWKEWSKQRAFKKEMAEAHQKFKAEHIWQPHVVSGCGKWVRKDGRPIRD